MPIRLFLLPPTRYLLMLVLPIMVVFAAPWLATAQPARQFDGTNYVWFGAPADDEASNGNAPKAPTTNPRKASPPQLPPHRQSASLKANGFLNIFEGDFHLEFADGFVGLDADQQVLKVVCSPDALQITVASLAHVTEWQQEGNAAIFNGGMGWKCLNAKGQADAFFRRRISAITITPARLFGYDVFLASFTTKDASFGDCLAGDSYINITTTHTPTTRKAHPQQQRNNNDPSSVSTTMPPRGKRGMNSHTSGRSCGGRLFVEVNEERKLGGVGG